ncbi:MAG: hypothetical protein ACYSWP_05165 [Planctomycetota bacterium]|jgi:NAD(P) transhydrogenase subunit alpha
MKLFFPKVTEPQENRVSLLPIDTAKLIKLGAQVEIESGIGKSINIPDQEYENACSHFRQN